MSSIRLNFISILIILHAISFNLFSSDLGFNIAVPNVNASFYLPPLPSAEADTSQLSQSDLMLKAESLLLNVKTSNRYIGILASNQPHELPVGIQKIIAGVEYTIVLDDLFLDPMGANLKAYMTLQFPGSDKKLGFFADNVRIGPDGIETAQLRLIKDEDVSMGAFTLRFRSDVTRIDWDCNGYSSTTIGGDVIFPSNLIKPLSGEAGDSIPMGSFFANFTDFNDAILGFSMEPFEVNGLPNFEFYPGSVFVDISDLRNPPNTVFPAGFFPANQPQQLNTLWRGLVIPSFTVKLPPGIGANGSESVEIGAKNMIIDGSGITGGLFAANILSIEQGSIGGWEFSIDTLGFTFFKNSFTGFVLTGEIMVPISNEQKGFRYAGTLDSQGDLSFSVAYTEKFNANLWGAKLSLDQNSSIQIIREGNTYKPMAILHGQMSIALSDEVNLGTFAFQDLILKTDEPYISIGACSLPNGLLAGFPVNITNLSFIQEDNLVGLSMQANVSFMADSTSGFGGKGAFTIWAERTSTNGKTKYQYKKTQVSGIAIDVDQGGFQFKGAVAFYQQDPVYGKGFKGMIQAKFQPGINVHASAQFGSVSGFRYWYVDALVAKSSGIQISPGAAIYGFGGGISYKMKLTEPSSYIIPEGNHTSADTTKVPGVVFSGATYVPNSTYGLGLKASVVFGTYPSPKAVNGEISFRIQFYANGGIESIRFQGEGCMASELKSNPQKVPIRLTMDISYNFTNKDLYGVSEAFVNLAVVKGMHPGNKAGSVVFRFSPDEWYVHVGTPDSRIGLKVFNATTFASYFMVGTNIPPFPAPPNNVTSILSGTNAQSFEEGLMATGSGFAFGSAFNMDTGEEEFLIFYGAFSLGAGFDIMLKNYGSTAYCEGFPPPIGVNGWYAMGQAYAYMTGKIGVKFKLFAKDRKMNILSISAAALLQAKLPNPLYFKGQAGGSYNIMGGLIKGKCSFDFSVGENCVVMGANPLGNIAVIADMSPSTGNTDVSVFVTPQVAFNMPLNEPFEMLDESNQTQKYRIQLSYLQVLADNTEIQGEVKWNESNDVVSFETTEIYPSQTDIEVKVRVVFQRYSGNQWVNHLVSGELQTEEQTISFTTGERPDHIPAECVVYTYPIAGMMNFHWQEHSTGYIKLTHNFGYLLNPEPEWQGVVVFDASTPNNQTSYSYNSSDLKVTFTIPQNLASQMVYNIRLAKIPTAQTMAIDANVKRKLKIQTEDVELTETEIEGDRSVSLERNLFEIKVRTSMYSSFSAKLDGMQLSGSSMQIVTTGIHNLIKFAELGERLDDMELSGGIQNQLIQMDINLDNNVWYNDYIKPLVYAGYPKLSGLTITWRDVNEFGIPPFKAVYCYQTANTSNIENLSSGTNFSYPGASIGIKFTGVVIMNQDYQDIKNKAASLYNPTSPNASTYLHFIDGFFMPIFTNQQYRSTLRYVIPGEDIVTTERVITFDI